MEPTVPADPLSGPARRETSDAAGEARAGLYLHVPFCARRCTYCDFATGVLAGRAVERWLDAIEREAAWRAPAAAGAAFSSAFFGGGTPSALTAAQFRRVWRAVRSSYARAPGAEWTLEANPESVRPERLEAWAEAGVNRLSMGAQSFHADELRTLGRLHDAARPAQAFALARAHGFRRLSLDLMFGFPGHTPERWRVTLEQALELEPEHLSAYCFIPEPGTPLGDAVLAGRLPLPDADLQAEMYERLIERAAAAGLEPYETSNLARPGAEARHNLVYWLRRPYLGLGPSAHGFWGGVRYANHRDPARWAAALAHRAAPESEREPERAETAADEIVMLTLRLARGLRPADHPGPHARAVMARYGPALAAAAATGRLEAHPEGWRIPRRAWFVADEVIAWLAARAATRGFDSPTERSVTFVPCPIPLSPAI